MSFRLAAYAVCVEEDRALLVLHRSGSWTLPGGRVEHAEDPLETVAREVLEETGCHGVVERLLGVDSRLIPAAERAVPGGADHQNVGIFYQVRLLTTALRPEENGDTLDVVWTALSQVRSLRRSSLVDVGLALAATLPANGHVDPVAVGGLVRH